VIGHTPGPWELANGLRVYAPGKAGPLLATVHDLPRTATQAHANARLMAAATELLQALRECLAVIEQHELLANSESFVGDQARAAIAKATGSAT
jgi:hypothetical protein